MQDLLFLFIYPLMAKSTGGKTINDKAGCGLKQGRVKVGEKKEFGGINCRNINEEKRYSCKLNERIWE